MACSVCGATDVGYGVFAGDPRTIGAFEVVMLVPHIFGDEAGPAWRSRPEGRVGGCS